MEYTTPLRKNYEFKRLYNRGESAASHLIVVYYKKNGTEYNRLGVTVSAKIGGAVLRNRIRRRLKEIYRLTEKSLKTGNDIVIVARMKSGCANYHELEASAMNLFRKLNLL
jgi:ribonuclease P protein component